jgi:hypothetical protein
MNEHGLTSTDDGGRGYLQRGEARSGAEDEGERESVSSRIRDEPTLEKVYLGAFGVFPSFRFWVSRFTLFWSLPTRPD